MLDDKMMVKLSSDFLMCKKIVLSIEHIFADQKYLLQNNNTGLRNHRYYEKDKYQSKFEVIWKELRREGINQRRILSTLWASFPLF